MAPAPLKVTVGLTSATLISTYGLPPFAMLNDQYEPSSPYEEEILELLEGGGWWAPTHVSEEMGVHRGGVNHHLKRLTAAGWLQQPKDGVYEFVCDPRELSDEEIADMHIAHAKTLLDVSDEENTETAK